MSSKEKHNNKTNKNTKTLNIKTTANEPLKPEKSDIKKSFDRILEITFIVLFNYFRFVGILTIQILRKFKKAFTFFYRKVLMTPVTAVRRQLARLGRSFGRCIKYVLFKLYMFLKFFFDAYFVIKGGFNKRAEKNFAVRILDALAAFFSGVFNNRRIFVTWLNYVAPVIALVGFVYVINYVGELNYAVNVEYNEQDIGYIENEMVFERAETKLQQRVTYLSDDEVIEATPRFTVEIVGENRLKDDLQLTDAMLKSSGEEIVKASGLTIDGQFYGAVREGHVIQQTLDDLLHEYETDSNAKAEFTNKITLDAGLYLGKNIKDEQEIIETITKKTQQEVFVAVQEGDTPIITAARNGLDLDEFVELNPGALEKFVIGQLVLVEKEKNFLPVSVTMEKTFTEKIPYEVNETKSSSYSSDSKIIKKQGVEGVREVLASVKYVDGIEISRTTISSEVVKEPITAEVIVGTSVYKPSQGGSYTGSVSSSGFIWPSSGGYISSYYGRRGRSSHSGVDYATAYGTPVRASMGGKVIYSGMRGTYGNIVKISHGNGIETWYAHNSSLTVKSGQMVNQGDIIAKVGSTGTSTGNHTHFEVRINGVTQNPLNYARP